ncbi:hypothetical protein BUALT_Bualt03G0101600 [Buddleja alternifolia]|uniref:25S rRNA (uridine-N(3))-methyltransferase BMT5-like domain-containing protein n=1 Tax=Buddleja alternifolia TaxID=168488 RepID=A0AAV6XZB9_9LAMI|nr:hypothetical protein BUALT_Bualt03G0101600 [Buddleja alternifolia]
MGLFSSSIIRLRKILSIHKFIFNASKNLSEKLRIIFVYLRRKPDEPILPIKDPTAQRIIINSNDPLLVQTLPSTDHLNTDDHEEFQNDNSVVVPCQQWAPEEINNYSGNYYVMQQMDDHVIISIQADFNHPLTHLSAFDEMIDSIVLEEEDQDEEDEEKVMIKSISSTMEEDEEEEEEKVINVNSSTFVPVVVDEGRWIKHYNSRHGILVVGDGDFSFSASLAVAFGCASHMIATSLDSKEFLRENYHKFMSNFKQLSSRGCKVMHGIDATTMATHELLGHVTFDRIIYNFPFAGFFKELSRKAQICRHRRLVSLFMKNAKEMLSENGEIHISHKINDFHNEWKLEDVAFSHMLRLIEAVDFNHLDYPGYNTKCGFGGDNNFNCYPSKTYKFGLKMVRY